MNMDSYKRFHCRQYILGIWRDALGKRADKLKKYQKPDAKSVNQLIDKNENLTAYVEKYRRSCNSPFDEQCISLSVSDLSSIKSSLLYLFYDKYECYKKEEREGSIPAVLGDWEQRLSEIKEAFNYLPLQNIKCEADLGPIPLNLAEIEKAIDKKYDTTNDKDEDRTAFHAIHIQGDHNNLALANDKSKSTINVFPRRHIKRKSGWLGFVYNVAARFVGSVIGVLVSKVN